MRSSYYGLNQTENLPNIMVKWSKMPSRVVLLQKKIDTLKLNTVLPDWIQQNTVDLPIYLTSSDFENISERHLVVLSARTKSFISLMSSSAPKIFQNYKNVFDFTKFSNYFVRWSKIFLWRKHKCIRIFEAKFCNIAVFNGNSHTTFWMMIIAAAVAGLLKLVLSNRDEIDLP